MVSQSVTQFEFLKKSVFLSSWRPTQILFKVLLKDQRPPKFIIIYY